MARTVESAHNHLIFNNKPHPLDLSSEPRPQHVRRLSDMAQFPRSGWCGLSGAGIVREAKRVGEARGSGRSRLTRSKRVRSSANEGKEGSKVRRMQVS
jgi:hypothetical protein